MKWPQYEKLFLKFDLQLLYEGIMSIMPCLPWRSLSHDRRTIGPNAPHLGDMGQDHHPPTAPERHERLPDPSSVQIHHAFFHSVLPAGFWTSTNQGVRTQVAVPNAQHYYHLLLCHFPNIQADLERQGLALVDISTQASERLNVSGHRIARSHCLGLSEDPVDERNTTGWWARPQGTARDGMCRVRHDC